MLAQIDLLGAAALLTRGADGAVWYDRKVMDVIDMPAFASRPLTQPAHAKD